MRQPAGQPAAAGVSHQNGQGTFASQKFPDRWSNPENLYLDLYYTLLQCFHQTVEKSVNLWLSMLKGKKTKLEVSYVCLPVIVRIDY